MEVDRLELVVETEIDKANASLDALASKLTAVGKGLNGLMQSTQTASKTSQSAYASVASGQAKAGKSSRSLITQIGNIAFAFMSLRTVGKGVMSAINSSMDFGETINLFQTTFRKIGLDAGEEFENAFLERAQTFNDKITTALGLDPDEIMNYQARFAQMSNSMGLVAESAYNISSAFTMLGADAASLFNIDIDKSMQKLQSGLAGQIRPLRELGVDISKTALMQTAWNYGITDSIEKMSASAKVQLRFITTMQQLRVVMGDMAKTIESPANQMRVLRQQTDLLKRSIGNTFLPLITKILPYLNGIVIALRTIIQEVAAFLGFELPDWTDSEIYTGIPDLAADLEDAGDAADTATNAIKKLKRATIGMDELNVLSFGNKAEDNDEKDTPLNSGYAVLDKAIAAEYEAYTKKFNDELAEMQNKAQEFADEILPHLKTILKIATVIGGVFIGWKLSKGFLSAIGGISSLFGGKKSGGKTVLGLSVPSPKTVLKGLADVALIIGGVITVVEAIGLLMKIPGFEETAKDGIRAVGIVFKGLWDIALPLITFSTGTVILGKIGVGNIAKGMAGMATIIGGTTGIITAIGAVLSIPYFDKFLSVGIESTKKVFKGLWEIAVPLGAATATIVALGFVTPGVVLSGLTGFAIIIGGVETVLVALGALNQIPGFQWIVGEGGKVLIQLGEILGGFAGSIVNGFLVEVSNSFPDIGTNLAGFMNNAQPFFKGLDAINTEAVNAVKQLAEMVLILTAADVLDGLTSWFTGGSSLVKFGKDLAEFAPYIMTYANTVRGIDAGSITASATAAKTLAEFADNVPKRGGLAAFFEGENDIDVWGAKLPVFGRCIKAYGDSIVGLKTEAIEASSTAAKSLTELSNNIPNSGGLAAFFAGDNSIDVWGAKLPLFGKKFAEYADLIKNVNPDVVTKSSDAAKSIAELANNLPSEGGIASLFSGDKSLAAFGDKLVYFGACFSNYAANISGVQIGQVSAISAEMDKILDWSSRVSSTDGKNIETFGRSLKSFASDFAEAAGKIVSGFTNKITTAYETSKTSVLNWANGVKNWFSSSSYGGVNKSTFETYASNLINGFKGKISSTASSVKPSIVAWANDIKIWFSSAASAASFTKIAADIVNGFNNGIYHNYSNTKSYMTAYGTNLIWWFTRECSDSAFYNAAVDVVNGFNRGIQRMYPTSKTSIVAWANAVVAWFDDVLDIHSPSRRFGNSASMSILGYNNTIDKEGKSTRQVIERWANSFSEISPTLSLAFDTSALDNYNASGFDRRIDTKFVNTYSVLNRPQEDLKQSIYSSVKSAMAGNSDGGGNWVIQIIAPDGSVKAEEEISKIDRMNKREGKTIIPLGI